MELTSLTLGAAAVAAIGGPAVDAPDMPVQQDVQAYVAGCKMQSPMVAFAEASKVLANAKVSAGFIVDQTVAEPSCQA